jgi:hypothetical protein
MAQTPDFIIDNGTGAEVRNDINTALMALATTNTGATPPQNPVFGMLWVDTTNACLKIYAGDDVWLIIIDSVVATATGGASSFPSGTKMVFHQAAVPPGWTQDTIDGAAMRVIDGTPGGSGGDVDFVTWNTGHVHPHTHSVSTSTGDGLTIHMVNYGNEDAPAGVTGGATSTSTTSAFKYVDVMICTKD